MPRSAAKCREEGWNFSCKQKILGEKRKVRVAFLKNRRQVPQKLFVMQAGFKNLPFAIVLNFDNGQIAKTVIFAT